LYLRVVPAWPFRRAFREPASCFYTAVGEPRHAISLFVGFASRSASRKLRFGRPTACSRRSRRPADLTLPFGLMMTSRPSVVRPRYEKPRPTSAQALQRFAHILPIIMRASSASRSARLHASYDDSPIGADGRYGQYLPLEIWAMTTAAISPVLFALGTSRPVVSFFV